LVEIADSNGKVLEKFNNSPADEAVVSAENCRAVINMMQAVISDGTGKGIRTRFGVEGEFAGKTGTTQENSDGWFIGLTPKLVTGCWVGADDPRVHFRTITYGQGAFMALPIVGGFFSKTYNNPRFSNLKNSTFAPPKPELYALLNNPQYKEILEIEKREWNLADIFRKKEKKEDLKTVEKGVEQTQPEKEDKKPVWTKIKDIFKKKDK
jgi:penicillin-binding protein 1A